MPYTKNLPVPQAQYLNTKPNPELIDTTPLTMAHTPPTHPTTPYLNQCPKQILLPPARMSSTQATLHYPPLCLQRLASRSLTHDALCIQPISQPAVAGCRHKTCIPIHSIAPPSKWRDGAGREHLSACDPAYPSMLVPESISRAFAYTDVLPEILMT